jgi:protocatechuate 3,4-dioxygenase beta subunit
MRARESRLWPGLLGAIVAVGVGIASVATLGGSTPAAADTPGGNSSCPASNPPNELTLAGGSPQTAQLNTPFGGLQVALANTDGCPVTSVAGTPVTFTAPVSGASGSFAASGSNSLTVGADASGNVSAAMFTANGVAGSYTVAASSAYGSVSFSLTNTAAGIPAAVTPLAPTSETATVDSAYSQPLSVRVLDANGNPVSGASVTFSLGAAAAGGGGGAGGSSAAASFADGSSQATAMTGSDGVATSPHFSANATAGSFTATATVAHAAEPASFELMNLPGKGERLTTVGKSKRSATVDHHYGQRLRVLVRDASGSPVVGASVTFTLGAAGAGGGGSGAGASFSDGAATATATTGVHGIATSPQVTASSVAGTFTATATATTTTSTARFTLTNVAGKPATIIAGVGAAESAQAGARFAIPLAVTVSDAHGNKVAGALVTFTAPTSGPSGSFATAAHPRSVTVRTDSSGIAVAPPFTANAQPGGYAVIARVRHGPRTAFALVNEAP